MYINHKVVVVLLFFLAVCICAGSFFEVSMTGAGKEHLEEMLSGLLNPENSGSGDSSAASFSACFLRVFLKNLVIIALAFISPVVFITLPVLPAYILLRGLSFGFSAAMTLEVTGIRGILYILTALLPQNLIQFPVYCLLAALSLQTGVMRIRKLSHYRKNARLPDAGRYSLIFALGLGVITLSCLLEAFLVTSI